MQVHKFKAGSTEWLDFRCNFVTGTEVASLFGLNKNASVAKVIRDKISPPEKIDNPFLRAGRVLEPGVIILMNEYGIPAEPAGAFGEVIYITHDKHKIGVSLDGKMNVEEGFYIVECKTTQLAKLQTWLENPPINYLLQVQAQLLATGTKKALLGAMAPVEILVYNKAKAIDFYLIVLEIEANKEIHKLIIEEVNRFWNCLDKEEKFVVNKEHKEKVERLIFKGINQVFVDDRLNNIK